MMKKIYGNENVLSTFGSMIKRDRAANSVILYGEKGSGKKLLADYYTSLLLCSAPENGAPCGRCPACRNAAAHAHPDVTYVQTSGKLGGYSVDTARAVCRDAFIKPNNNSGRKVYQFRDCRNMDVRTQNTLLKLIEEPPAYAFFIFTAESKYEFLETIISRCICLGTSLCTGEEAAAALAEEGFSREDALSAVSCFHGNIGMCIRYLTDSELKEQVDLTKRIADSIIKKDEYELLCSLSSAGTERNSIRSVLTMADMLFRDAAVLGKDSSAAAVSCCPDAAAELSMSVTAAQVSRIHRCISRAWETVSGNVNPPLALTALCAEIMETIE